MSEKCEWKDNGEYFESTCKLSSFWFDIGGPEDNGFKFCPYCGLPLVEDKSATEYDV